jgi:hypothetical protein
MKLNWRRLAIAVPLGASTAVLAIIVIAYRYGNQPSTQDMELAAELGAALGGALALTWPLRLLKR